MRRFGRSRPSRRQPTLRGLAQLWAGDRAAGGGAGLPLGDGLRCAGGTGVRVGVRSPSPAGDGIWGPNLRTLGGWTAGDTRYFQVGCRDARGTCGSSFNLTNGFMVTFSG